MSIFKSILARLRATARNAGLGILWYRLTRFQRSVYRWLTVPVRPLPDFLIIGASKCGTTSLHNYLNQHPKVEQGIWKEIHFFDQYPNYAKGLNWYRTHFPVRTDPDAFCLGEATPAYLFNPAVPERVADAMPKVKLIVLVRNPIDRAYSHYHHTRRGGNENLPFENAIEAESDRISDELKKLESNPTYYDLTYAQYSYLARGRYMEQIERWLQYFPREQMIVIQSQALFSDPDAFCNRIFEFLDLEPYSLDVGRAYNSGEYRNQIAPDTRSRLRAYFRPHNEALAEFLGEPLDWR